MKFAPAMPPAAPTGALANPAAVCSGSSSQLSATPGSGGDTVEWFTVSCGGTAVSGGASPTVSPSVTTNYYARTKNSATGSTSSTCATVTVTVNTPTTPADLDRDCDVDDADFLQFDACFTGPQVPGPPVSGCTAGQFDAADSDGDMDVDQTDFAVFQRCYSGEGNAPDPLCAE